MGIDSACLSFRLKRSAMEKSDFDDTTFSSIPLAPFSKGEMILLVIPSGAKESHVTQMTQIVMMT